ncbi:hypothetical protein AVEN_204550-1 [Araneus ventricosus]|uniref:Uncharacterized protein n=1 Tax=Araneus ventricosus TaxID=182803 RepID=A0A4Y2MBL8_ARAVE|nr:hypothetical protein AVEN_204550-1 [Araneus ventricosus]
MLRPRIPVEMFALIISYFCTLWRFSEPLCPSGKVSDLSLIPLQIHRVWDMLHDKSYIEAKHSPAGAVRKFREGVQSQVSPRHLVVAQNYEVNP